MSSRPPLEPWNRWKEEAIDGGVPPEMADRGAQLIERSLGQPWPWSDVVMGQTHAAHWLHQGDLLLKCEVPFYQALFL